ncbi:DUF2884 family protein [Aliikangiella maris]|uniref:DUF2884 family protein n=2 Tax=Aliikangiella maris TaxID=3162458 RepID=A0ABV3MNS9_9GAMM
MKKTLLALMLSVSSTTLVAESEQCNFTTDYNINIESEQIRFTQTDGDTFEFAGEKLLINDKAVKLNDEQLKASLALQQKAREMVPVIAEVAIEGAELGIKAATMVVTALFADDEAAQQELMLPIEALTKKLKTHVSSTQFNIEQLEQTLDNAFDEEFSQAIEAAVAKFSGKMVGSVLTTLFSGDNEEMKDFEFRMENLEYQVEEYVEKNAEQLEKKASKLCEELVKLEVYDAVLETVPGYPKGGLFEPKPGRHFDFEGFNIKKSSDDSNEETNESI